MREESACFSQVFFGEEAISHIWSFLIPQSLLPSRTQFGFRHLANFVSFAFMLSFPRLLQWYKKVEIDGDWKKREEIWLFCGNDSQNSFCLETSCCANCNWKTCHGTLPSYLFALFPQMSWRGSIISHSQQTPSQKGRCRPCPYPASPRVMSS